MDQNEKAFQKQAAHEAELWMDVFESSQGVARLQILPGCRLHWLQAPDWKEDQEGPRKEFPFA